MRDQPNAMKQLAELGIEVTPEAEAEIEAEKSAPADAE